MKMQLKPMGGWPGQQMIQGHSQCQEVPQSNMCIKCVHPRCVKTDERIGMPCRAGGIMTVEEEAKGPVMSCAHFYQMEALQAAFSLTVTASPCRCLTVLAAGSQQQRASPDSSSVQPASAISDPPSSSNSNRFQQQQQQIPAAAIDSSSNSNRFQQRQQQIPTAATDSSISHRPATQQGSNNISRVSSSASHPPAQPRDYLIFIESS
ncbi:hypothetical protein WN943_009894 [Citrus x changshan-huyou]